MTNLKFNDGVKSKVEELKEKTLIGILRHDEHYQTIYTEETLAEKEYQNLDLTKEQKKIVDNLLSLIDTRNMEYGTLNYIAGIYDSPKFFTILNLLAEKENSEIHILRNFYRCKMLAKELFKESSSSKKLWDELDYKEQKFISSLTKKQQNSYSKTISTRAKLLDSLLEDQFVSSFQLGAEFMLGITEK